MSYEKQTWANGDVITANGLNHMEDGIAGAGGGAEPLIVNVTVESSVATADKTWRELYTAFNSGRLCPIIWEEDIGTETPTHRRGLILGLYSYGGEIGGADTSYTAVVCTGVSTVEVWDTVGYNDPDTAIYHSYD